MTIFVLILKKVSVCMIVITIKIKFIFLWFLTWLAYNILSNVGFSGVVVSILDVVSLAYLPPVEFLLVGCFNDHSKSVESLSVTRGGWRDFSWFSWEFAKDSFSLFFSEIREALLLVEFIFGLLDFYKYWKITIKSYIVILSLTHLLNRIRYSWHI